MRFSRIRARRSATLLTWRGHQVLYGEGDRFGCVLDIPVERIVWCAAGGPGPTPGPACTPGLSAGRLRAQACGGGVQGRVGGHDDGAARNDHHYQGGDHLLRPAGGHRMRRGAAPRHAPRRRGAAGRRARARAAAKYARGSEVCRKYVLCACRAVSATAARHDSLAAGAGRAPGRRQEAELFAPRIQLVTRCMAGAGALQHAGHSPALCRSSACCLPRRVCCQVGHLLSRTTIHPVASPSCESRTATSARCHRRLAEQRAEARDAAALARLARIKGEAAATGRARMLLKGAQPAIQITLGRDEDPDSPARRPPAPRRAHSCHHLRPASRSRSSLAMASKPSASVCICSVRPCRLRSRSPRCSRRERVSSRPAPSASALRAAARQAAGRHASPSCRSWRQRLRPR